VDPTVLVAVMAACGALLIALLFLVLWLRSRAQRTRERLDRAESDRLALDLELSLREQRGRLRIVRELHEVAAHSVSTIVAQAEGVRYAAETDAGAATRSAAAIEDAARNLLADLRRVMTIVRDGEARAEPQPRLQSARDLFAIMRDAGLDIVFTETGKRFEIKQGAELAIYRILQESLSNALKHGGEGTEVRVSFTWTDNGLQVLVDDDGVRAAARREGLDPNEAARQHGYTLDEDLASLTRAASGPGISEMRKRTELFGGVFNAYRVPGVGFSVAAVFPSLRYHNGVHGVNLRGS
jgi:signal transduction histidine kinase